MILIAFSGRLQSGKDTLCDFLLRNRKEFFDVEEGKKFRWAAYIKQDLEDKFDVPYEWLHGDNDAKNNLTAVKWEDVCDFCNFEITQEQWDREYLTVRELLQVWGTEIVRKINKNAWVDSTRKEIKLKYFGLVVLADTRFPNEVEAIKKDGGLIIRLTRNCNVPAIHKSEIALDKDRYDWSNFDGVIDNGNLTLMEQEKELVKLLELWGWKK